MPVGKETFPLGVLLLQLGTPSAPTRGALRTYLKQFLSDPRVVELPSFFRWLLVNGIILPSRVSYATRLYKKIWGPEGSPLLVHSEALGKELQEALGSSYKVALGMRYGKPSIEEALHALLEHSPSHLKILPLFPHYSSAVTGSALEETLRILKKLRHIPSFEVIHDFFQHPAYIEALVQVIQPSLSTFHPEHLLFSYHGLPLSQARKSEGTPFCYSTQCKETAKHVIHALKWPEEKYSVSFQSRLGKLPWLQPYTENILSELASRGIKRLAVISPSFVADCLETLEEIDLRGREQWLQLGGEAFHTVPCLNTHPVWIQGLKKILLPPAII